MDWELIFWVVGGILGLLFLLAVVVCGPHIPDERIPVKENRANFDEVNEWDW